MLISINRKKIASDEHFDKIHSPDKKGFIRDYINIMRILHILPVPGDTVGEVSSLIKYDNGDDIVWYEAEQPPNLISQMMNRAKL